MSQVQSKEPETPRRLFTLKCVNSDQVIHMGPCIVGNIVVSSDDGVGGASVYDGLNNLAERKVFLRCPEDDSASMGAAQDHDFKHGIYVDVLTGSSYVMISYYPLEV